MFLELKSDLLFAREYLNTLKLLEKDESMIETKHAINEALTLIKLLNDRIAIAEVKVSSAPLPEARTWSDIKLEYEALYHLERLHNGQEHWGGEGD